MANSTTNNSNIWPVLNNTWIPIAPPPTQISGTSITGGTGFIVPGVSATGGGGGTGVALYGTGGSGGYSGTPDYPERLVAIRCIINFIRYMQMECYAKARETNNPYELNLKSLLTPAQQQLISPGLAGGPTTPLRTLKPKWCEWPG